MQRDTFTGQLNPGQFDPVAMVVPIGSDFLGQVRPRRGEVVEVVTGPKQSARIGLVPLLVVVPDVIRVVVPVVARLAGVGCIREAHRSPYPPKWRLQTF